MVAVFLVLAVKWHSGRQNQLAKMTSDLCDDGGEKQREKETLAAPKASSVSPLSADMSPELPGAWNVPLSPVMSCVQIIRILLGGGGVFTMNLK